MEYITTSRFKTKAICGEINLSYATKCECVDDYITYKGKTLCYIKSQNAFDYFARNDDDKGLERGNLIKKIIKCLANPNNSQKRWNKIWANKSLYKFKRDEEFIGDDTWLWNYNFYNAHIYDLKYIYNLIKEV